jgi:hypothetical protein
VKSNSPSCLILKSYNRMHKAEAFSVPGDIREYHRLNRPVIDQKKYLKK